MPVLHLGVFDVPYVQAASRRRRKRTAGTTTTGDVAGFLENKYHIFEIFFLQHQDEVIGDLERGLHGTVDNLLLGAPVSIDPFGAAASKIEDRLKQFIAMGEMDKLGYPGVPTQAARDRASGKRRSARMKRARPSNASPVSFIDSGLYQSSIHAWLD